MNNRQRKQLSKKMSYALRHHPEKFSLSLDANGWTPVADLATAMQASIADIIEVVQTESDKVRFTIKEFSIRAAQGHSVPVDLQLAPVEPPLLPALLFHGTHTGVLGTIFERGLIPMTRTHVHLTADCETARRVGARRGKPVILQVNARHAYFNKRVLFYQADNGVWLADMIPPAFICAPFPPQEA